MGVLRIDHPDIEEFIHAKQNMTDLKAFNLSIAITDEFMEKVIRVDETGQDELFNLTFEGRIYKQVSVRNLWEEVMRSTWEWAEPGVLYIDRMNRENNLWYCEEIRATNPCGEQPLPPGGACLLGSWNLVKYIFTDSEGNRFFGMDQFKEDIPHIVRAMDNIHDIAIFPLPIQAEESRTKRRMGLGMTGVANAGEALGFSYGSPEFLEWYEEVLQVYTNYTYSASADLAAEKGSFPLFDVDKYMEGPFIKRLPSWLQLKIRTQGIRNSHLLSMAPTGTISLTADNVSGGIEPVFSHYYDRTIRTDDGEIVERVTDYAYATWGIKGKTANECTAKEHLDVLAMSTKYVDSAVSKTINVAPTMPWGEFKSIYIEAYKLGCKGCTTFNSGGKRFGIFKEVKEEEVEDTGEAKACFIDTLTGQKECS
jgi:ribonucleoside-diphosphate reductase alpha chain